MSEVDDLLEQVRNEEPSRRPRGRTALLAIAGLATVAALSGATVLAVSASASIVSFDAQNSAAASDLQADPDDVTVTGGVDTSDDIEAEPAETTTDAATDAAADAATDAAASAASDDPVVIYDADTDFSTIPGPPADWAESELENAKIWMAQQEIIGDCMAEQGYDYEFIPFWENMGETLPDGTPSVVLNNGAPGSTQWVALWGADDQPLGEDYDWQQAGCVGYAVHVTGMDDAN